MNKLRYGCLLLLIGTLLSPVQGQVALQAPGAFQNHLILPENKAVQADLELTAEQVAKIGELSRKQLEGLRGLGFGDNEKRKQVMEASRKGLDAILTAAQAKRLKQLEMQQHGVAAFADPQVAKTLGISKEQQAGITRILQGFGGKWMAAVQAARGNQPEMQKKIAELNRGLTADVVKTLTAEQQAKWRELTGEPFAGLFPVLMPNLARLDLRPPPTLNWIMNDLAAAQAEARKTGKPIFVTFRCEA